MMLKEWKVNIKQDSTNSDKVPEISKTVLGDQPDSTQFVSQGQISIKNISVFHYEGQSNDFLKEIIHHSEYLTILAVSVFLTKYIQANGSMFFLWLIIFICLSVCLKKLLKK